MLDHLEVAQVHLVGNSVGGLVGLELARTVPHRPRTLTTFGTTTQLSSSRGLVRTMSLLVHCDLDRSLNRTLATTLARIEERNDAIVVDLPDAGHFANLEQPDGFHRIVRGFLAQHR